MVTLIQRTVCEIFIQIPHTAIYIMNMNAQSNTLLSSHIQAHYTENNSLLITTITDEKLHPWRTKVNQYAYKLPSKPGALSYFGHNATTTPQNQCSRDQTLHN